MCRYTIFTFLCGSRKLKIAEPCDQLATNYQGLDFCRDEPHAHVDDHILRDYLPPTHGPGVCSNENCRILYSVMSAAQSKRNRKQDMIEDDREFDMSEEACKEREDRWFHECLSTEQQLEAVVTSFPVPLDSLSLYARAWLYDDQIPSDAWVNRFGEGVAAAGIEDADWKEFNPRYMSMKALHSITAQIILPASVTDTRSYKITSNSRKTKTKSKGKNKAEHTAQPLNPRAHTTTPLKPFHGPFSIPPHTHHPAKGRCTTCGSFHSRRDTPFTPTQTTVHGNNFDRQILSSAHGLLSPEQDAALLDHFLAEFVPTKQDGEGGKWVFRNGKEAGEVWEEVMGSVEADEMGGVTRASAGKEVGRDQGPVANEAGEDEEDSIVLDLDGPSADQKAVDSGELMDVDFGL